MNAQSAAALLFLAFVLIAALMVWIGRDPEEDIDPSRPEGSWSDEEKEAWCEIDSIDLAADLEGIENAETQRRGENSAAPSESLRLRVSAFNSEFENWGCE
jgi:hypothetical protein